MTEIKNRFVAIHLGGRQDTKTLCLPISPLGLVAILIMEAEVGIEPAYTELQSAA